MSTVRKTVKCPVCLTESRLAFRDSQSVHKCLSCERTVRILGPEEFDSEPKIPVKTIRKKKNA